MNPMMLLCLLAISPSAPGESSLPSIDLLRGLRSAEIAHLEGDHVQEFETLRQVLETFPDDMVVLYSVLVHHRSHEVAPGEKEKLEQTLIAILEDPGSVPTPRVLELVTGDPEAERKILEKVAAHLERRTQATAADAGLLELLSEAYRRLRDDAGSVSALERLVAIEPTTLRRWRLLNHYRQQDRLQEAIALVLAWQEEPDAPGVLLKTSIDLLSRAGRLADVEKQLDLYIEQQVAERRALLGEQSLPDIRNFDGTPAATTSVIQNAAWNFRDAGKDEAAEKYFRRALELSPDDEELRNTLLYLYGSEEELRQRQAEEAARWQEEEDPNSLFTRGTDLLTAGDAAGAFELLERAAPGLPQLEAAWYNLGMAAYRLEKWETVASAFGHAAQLNATRTQTFFYRGLALEKLGRCSESVEALERTLELEADQPLAHYYLAACLMRLGEREKAAEHRAIYDASRQ